MEQFPKQEGGEQKVEKEKVLELLRSMGFEGEAKEAVMQWTKQREAEVHTSREAIEFNIERSELYEAIGDIGGVLECLEDARMQAHQENEEDLYKKIMETMDALERA